MAVNSATAGLHLALAGLKIGPGDEVITTPMTFCATVQAILHVGATPVLADIGWDGNIDPEEIAQAHHQPHAGDHTGAHGGTALRHERHLGAGAASTAFT